MNIVRKILSGETEQARFFELASIGGYNTIELLWTKYRSTDVKVLGFEIPREIKKFTSGVNSTDVDMGSEISLIGSWTVFNPDGDNRCWAYVLDTPKNRNMLARALKTGWYKVTDQKVRDEIIAIAKSNGYRTEKIEKPVSNIKKTAREKAAESKVDQLSEEIIKLRRLLAEKEDAKQLFDKMTKKVDAEQATAPEVKVEEPKPEKPPLKGIHLDRDKIGK